MSQKDAVFACLRQQPIGDDQERARSPDQVQHCEEVADILNNPVQRATDGDFEKGENHMVFFAYKSDNWHVVQARDDGKKGRWTTVTEHRRRIDPVANSTATAPRRVCFGNKPRINNFSD